MLTAFLYTIFFILFGIFSWRRLDWGIYVIIFALPAYLVRFEIFTIPATLLESMVIILFLVWLLLVCKKDKPEYAWPQEIKRFVVPISLFLLAATMAVFVSPQLRAAGGIWKAYFIEPLLFFIVFVNVINSKEKLRNVFWVLGLSLVIPSLVAIYQKITGNLIPLQFWAAEETRRVTSVYGYPNAIGLFFAPIVTIFIGWLVNFFQGKNYKNLFLTAVVAALGGLSIIFAVSKGAVLAVAVGILFYLIFWPGLRKWFAGLLIVGVVLAFVTAPQLLSIDGQKTVAGGGSLEIRTEQWQESLIMLKSRPLLGAGLSGYQARVAPYHQKDYIEIFMYPHQILLNFWVEIGLLGVIAFVWLIVLFYKRGFHVIKDKKDKKGTARLYSLLAMGGMTTLLIHGLVDVPYFKNDLSMLFWILFGLVVIIFRIKKPSIFTKV